MVQDEFGDLIRIGDGDEVEAVIHPVAPGSESVYDFLLADSVTLNLPATRDTIRVYEVQVRPKNFDAPGFVGSVFLDRATKAIVRMSFTFTPASYVDSLPGSHQHLPGKRAMGGKTLAPLSGSSWRFGGRSPTWTSRPEA